MNMNNDHCSDDDSSQGNGLRSGNCIVSSSSGALNTDVNHSNQYMNMHPLMTTSSPFLHQHGNQIQQLYQNSLLDVANMMYPHEAVPSVSSTTADNHSNSLITQGMNNILGTEVLSGGYYSSGHGHSVGNTHSVLSTLSTNENLTNQTSATTLGGVRIPPVPPNASTAQQVQIAAAAAAAEAAPPKGYPGHKGGAKNNIDICETSDGQDLYDLLETPVKRGKRSSANAELTEEEKKQLNRDRNRQHAKSTRLRKKAYVNKLKELVDGLHAERSEEARKQRVAVQHLAELQDVRRQVIVKFLQFHSSYESDARKWETILEDGFFLKQPLTPFRFFPTFEIEQSQEHDCRISYGIDAIVNDSASMSVMIESVGFRSTRWQNIKREEFLCREEAKTGKVRQRMPESFIRQNSRMQHAISSLSSSSGSSNWNEYGIEEERRKQKTSLLNRSTAGASGQNTNHNGSKQVSSSSSGGSSSLSNRAISNSNNDFHDYDAQPLPDPKLDVGSTSSDSTTNASDNAVAGKHLYVDSSSSGDDEKPAKKRAKKCSVPPNLEIPTQRDSSIPTAATQDKDIKKMKQLCPVTDPSVSSNSDVGTNIVKPVATRSALPPNIARSGGISHNIRPVASEMNTRLSTAPPIALPPFAGIGKRFAPVNRNSNVITENSNHNSNGIQILPSNNFVRPKVESNLIPSNSLSSKANIGNETNSVNTIPANDRREPAVIYSDNGTASSDNSSFPQIQANYFLNEDDMLLTDDVLMSPFIFRTQDAVQCGALSECVMPGMLRAEFSERNKLLNVEMVYDAMGFMQQLERSSGNEGKAHITPNSLEASLQPTVEEARVITTAKPPYQIVSVNEVWTRTTKYTQAEAEQKELSILNGKRTDPDVFRRPGKPLHESPSIAKGQPGSSTNRYTDKFGRDFIAYVTSYPITNNTNETTHILHIFKELK